MTLSSRARGLALCVLAGMLAGLSGCKSDGVQAGAASSVDISPDPPTFNERFQARNPRVCATLTTPPTLAQAKELVQCAWEAKSVMDGMAPSLGLVTDLQVQMSAPHEFRMGFVNPIDVDTKGQMYELRGQGTSWTCSHAGGVYTAGQNCARYEAVPKGVGACWHTTFNDWKCEMTVGGGTYSNRLKGPITF